MNMLAYKTSVEVNTQYINENSFHMGNFPSFPFSLLPLPPTIKGTVPGGGDVRLFIYRLYGSIWEIRTYYRSVGTIEYV